MYDRPTFQPDPSLDEIIRRANAVPISSSPQQSVQHVPRELDESDWFRAVWYGVIAGLLPLPLGMLVDPITHDNNITGELFFLFVCIVSWIVSFITTKKVGLKRAGVLSGFVADMTCGILSIIIMAFEHSSASEI